MFLSGQRAVQDHGVARMEDGAPGRAALAVHMRFECTGVGSCAWGVMPSPLHAVRMKRCGHLVPFRTKSLPRPTSKARQHQRPQPSRTPPTQGVYVACVPASVRHACSACMLLRLCGMHAGSCSEAYMTLCACSCRACLCLCLCCMRARACPGLYHGDKGDSWNRRSRSRTMAGTPSFGLEAWGVACGLGSCPRWS